MERAAEACRAGNLEYMSTVDAKDLERLISRTDEDDRSLLHSAASSGSAPLVDFLISQGASPMVNRQDEEVRNTPHYCALTLCPCTIYICWQLMSRRMSSETSCSLVSRAFGSQSLKWQLPPWSAFSLYHRYGLLIIARHCPPRRLADWVWAGVRA